MTPQELKNSILQLAIQGKLVEQRPEEGTAEELYRQIQKEKQRLIKAGKIKKEKPLPEIAEEEKPFEIPESWMWVRLGNIVNIVSARRVHQSDWQQEGIPFYRAREFAKLAVDGYVNNDLFISQELYDEFSKSGVPEPGDLMVTAVGTLGKTYIVQKGDKFYYKDASVICLENYAKLSSEYVRYIMQSEMMMKQIRNNSSGTTVATLTMVRMVEYIIPLPPLAEQKRIATKIDELLPYIDRYEQAWNRLEKFNKCFPDNMKKSILQMAIQGKLVEQRPDEGTAEELHQQIQAEKQQLIKSGKIKKEKSLPEITENEVPFDIPENWKWVHLGDVAWFFDAGKSPNCQKQPVKGDEWGVITTTSIQLGFFDDMQNKVLPDNFVVKKSMQVEAGDILITRAGPTNRTGIACLVKECRFNLILSDKTLRINMTNQYIYKDYVVMVLNSPQIRQMIIGLMSGMDKQQVNISQDKYKTLLIPIPPLGEQKRIMAKLGKILPLCEMLE